MRYLAGSMSAKALDENAQRLGISGMVLMERAALSTAEFIKNRLSEDNKRKRVIAVCGSGNNGGDGIACARILYEWGFNAEVLIVGKKEKFTEQTKAQVEFAIQSGVELLFMPPYDIITENYNMNDAIIIDAIFGVGFKGRLEGDMAELSEYISKSNSIKVAVDIPSGVNGSNGQVETVAIRADYTVTFGVNKVGMAVYPGKDYAGEIVIADIGFPKKAVCMTKFDAFTFDEEDIPIFINKREEYSNKGDFGKILIVAGSEDMCGASYLSALAAYRTGAGLVRIFTPEANRSSLQNLIPEAILTTYNDRPDTEISPDTADRLITAMQEWADAVVVGPGLGRGRRSKSIVEIITAHSDLPTIIDADGLWLFREVMEEKLGRRFSLIQDVRDNFVLTPHIKELSDLLYLPVKEVKDNIILYSEKLSRCEGTIVIKEARSLVVTNGSCYINNSGNSGMAKGGSGDVLTGILSALLAKKKDDMLNTVSVGVYIHGLAGDLLKKRKGNYGILARELADEIAEVMKRYA